MAIELGAPAIDRTGERAMNTVVSNENPATASGTIDHLEIFLYYYDVVYELDFATFSADGNNLTTNGYVEGLTGNINFNEWDAPGDFTAFDVAVGEYIGAWGERVIGAGNALVRRDYSGVGFWEKVGDHIPCSDVAFTWEPTTRLSLFASGAEGVVGLAKMVQVM